MCGAGVRKARRAPVGCPGRAAVPLSRRDCLSGSSGPEPGRDGVGRRAVRALAAGAPFRNTRRFAPGSKLPRALARASASSDSRLPSCERGAVAGRWPPFHTFPPIRRAANKVRCRQFSLIQHWAARFHRMQVRERRPVLPVGASDRQRGAERRWWDPAHHLKERPVFRPASRP